MTAPNNPCQCKAVCPASRVCTNPITAEDLLCNLCRTAPGYHCHTCTPAFKPPRGGEYAPEPLFRPYEQLDDAKRIILRDEFAELAKVKPKLRER